MKTKTLFIKRNKINIMLDDENGNTIVCVAIDEKAIFTINHKKRFFLIA